LLVSVLRTAIMSAIMRGRLREGVDSCSAPASRQAFGGRMREMQIRCGNKQVK
jgi:hypothetical protein